MISAIYFEGKPQVMENVVLEKALEIIRSPHHVWIDIKKSEKEDIKSVLKIIFPEHHRLIEKECVGNATPKIEVFDEILFMVFKTLPEKSFSKSQMNIILGKDFLVTIRTGRTDLSKVVEYIKTTQKGGITSDYILYRILSHVLSHYTPVIESITDRVEHFAEKSIKDPRQELLRDIIKVKKESLDLHGILIKEKGIAMSLWNDAYPQIRKKNIAYMRDLYDMVIQLTDSEAIARDILSTTIEIHVSSVSNKLNEIMKVLTIVTCFVMVPALIAGIYGMNFQHMPEISWEYGYYFALGMMGICMLVLYLFFKRRNWL